jgi:hypothetical protein
MILSLRRLKCVSPISITVADHGKAPVLAPGTTDTYIVHTGQTYDVNIHADHIFPVNDDRDATIIHYGSIIGDLLDLNKNFIGTYAIWTNVNSNGDCSAKISSSLEPGQYIVRAHYEDWTEMTLIYDDQVNLKVIDNTSTNIPEFPSVAVPVAAILGLVVIFGRKKREIE